MTQRLLNRSRGAPEPSSEFTAAWISWLSDCSLLTFFLCPSSFPFFSSSHSSARHRSRSSFSRVGTARLETTVPAYCSPYCFWALQSSLLSILTSSSHSSKPSDRIAVPLSDALQVLRSSLQKRSVQICAIGASTCMESPLSLAASRLNSHTALESPLPLRQGAAA